MRARKQNNDDFKPSFKNTRSKLYKHKPSFDRDDKSSSTENNTTNTGGYWKQKGNQAFKNQQYDKAIQDYTKAIEINPGESQYYSNRSKCYQKKGQYQLSLKDAQAACELDQHNIKAHYICGCVLAQMGKFDDSKLSKADNRLKKALRLCRTKQTPEFEQQISIKTFRLKKLCWLKNKEKDIRSIQAEMELVKKAYDKYQINKQRYEGIIKRLESELQILKEPQQIPDFLICKITLMLMEDPVLSEEGFSYERKELEYYYQMKGMVQPITRKPVSGKIFPNHSLKQAIEQFLKDSPWAFEEEKNQDYRSIVFI